MRTRTLREERVRPTSTSPIRLISRNAPPRLITTTRRLLPVTRGPEALRVQRWQVDQRASGWVRPFFAMVLVLISGLGTVFIAWACAWIVGYGWASFLRTVSWPWMVGICHLVPYADIPPVRCDQVSIVQGDALTRAPPADGAVVGRCGTGATQSRYLIGLRSTPP
jgi:hypothetical protein